MSITGDIICNSYSGNCKILLKHLAYGRKARLGLVGKQHMLEYLSQSDRNRSGQNLSGNQGLYKTNNAQSQENGIQRHILMTRAILDVRKKSKR